MLPRPNADAQWNSPALEDLMISVIARRFNLGDPRQISAGADLTLDLGLDSMQLVQVLVDLEVEHGVTVPEAALNKDDFSTVAALAKKITAWEQSQVPSTVADEPELDIKVHCFVSCLCEPLKRTAHIDHRPFYFGVWDAEIFIDEQYRLSYHTDNVSHEFFVHWYQRLYGVKLVPWYDHGLSKSANLQRLQQQLAERKPQEWIMAMLDLYQLPERENKFNKNPFPHYVMLENMADPEQIWMWDPDFRWEGPLDKQRVLQAVAQPCVAGGYVFSTAALSTPEPGVIDAYFQACLIADRNPMTTAVRNIIDAHVTGKNSVALAALADALRELPVLAIRKYAYEHGLAFFWRDLALAAEDFEAWCTVIEALVKTYDQVQFLAMKYTARPDPHWLLDIESLLQEQDVREFRIKAELARVYQQWRCKYGLHVQAAQGEMAEVTP